MHTSQGRFLNEEHTSTYALISEMHPIEALSLKVHKVLELNIDSLVLPIAPFSNLEIITM